MSSGPALKEIARSGIIPPMTPANFRPQIPPLVSPSAIELFPRDMTAIVAADVSLHDLQNKLAVIDQWLPIDGDPSRPIGELVEMNSTGPLRLGYGAWRDLLLGCQFTNGRDELITAGGRAYKNVAGYDVTKLMVGQQGHFGTIRSITTRTYKRPECAIIVEFAVESGLVNRLLSSACKPQWMILSDGGLLAGFLGDERKIDHIDGAIAEFSPIDIRRVEPSEEQVIRQGLWESSSDGTEINFRASVPPSCVLNFAENAKLTGWVADAAFGIVRGHCPEEQWEFVREAAKGVGGGAWGIERTESSNDFASNVVLQRLKESFE